MEMIVQMQKDRWAQLEVQQKMQEELVQQNQQVQKEIMDAVLAATAPLIEAPSSSERLKLSRTTLQKLSSSDDIESNLDTF